MTQSTAPVTTAKETGLGTFGGVYTPSMLTILGVIMYLSFGWVVGNVGLLGSWLIVTMAVSITLNLATAYVGAVWFSQTPLGLDSAGG